VRWLLSVAPDAQMEAVPGAAAMPARPGSLAHTLRFDPQHSHTSGLFVARVRRRESK
jgi:hypothetical protein